MIKPQQVILASASPRRRELLKKVFPAFAVIPTEVEEIVPEGTKPMEQSEYLAMIKARPLAEQYPDALVIGSDTTVLVDGIVLGKPRDAEEAKAMLRLLSGRTHVVCTGCCLYYKGRAVRFTESTEVEFYPMTEEEIDAYVASGDPMDKAGAYGIQSGAGIYIKGIRGDYDTVMGLPAARIYQEIKGIE